jgi:uncharacterized short protein YbdD (DUF466 family)
MARGGSGVTSPAGAIVTGFRSVWDFVRAVMGDQAYERYLDSMRRAGTEPLSPKEFYLDSIKRRYSTVSRCC